MDAFHIFETFLIKKAFPALLSFDWDHKMKMKFNSRYLNETVNATVSSSEVQLSRWCRFIKISGHRQTDCVAVCLIYEY